MVFRFGQAEADIFRPREIDGPGARQTEHGRISDLTRAFSRLEGGVGDVVGGQNLAAPDQRGDLVPIEHRLGDQGTWPVPLSKTGSSVIFWACASCMNRL